MLIYYAHLGRGQRQAGVTIQQCKERCLLAIEKLFDNNVAACIHAYSKVDAEGSLAYGSPALKTQVDPFYMCSWAAPQPGVAVHL